MLFKHKPIFFGNYSCSC
ncbi:hypothetical protein Goshw_014750 [Gossypium schwendimanii]|uniref:Uncharacterized protein n=1 Tax=Gossypium schwendimanii TaxID=34291 RepID=A0A7J9NEA6_GOSSC|nr:hypothetical protein [Gossypium schwendimanii]